MNTEKSYSPESPGRGDADAVRRVGIMGGTFDPIHVGHLILGECAYEQFRLDKVLYMPSGNPPHKKNRDGGTNEQRCDMTALAVKNNPHFELSLEEMHEMGYIYTSITLGRLRRKHPDTHYFFIMGADSLMYFDQWKDPDVIASLCTIVVAVRDHMEMEELDKKILLLTEQFDADIRKLSSPNVDVSSSMIRSWIAQGRSCRYYLPDNVIDYIRANRIYEAGNGKGIHGTI